VLSDSLSWISGELPRALADGGVLKCLYKARYRQTVEECIICLANAESREALVQGLGVAGSTSGEFLLSTFCRLQPIPPSGQQLQVSFPAIIISYYYSRLKTENEFCDKRKKRRKSRKKSVGVVYLELQTVCS
jgi:hypothetical protein